MEDLPFSVNDDDDDDDDDDEDDDDDDDEDINDGEDRDQSTTLNHARRRKFYHTLWLVEFDSLGNSIIIISWKQWHEAKHAKTFLDSTIVLCLP